MVFLGCRYECTVPLWEFSSASEERRKEIASIEKTHTLEMAKARDGLMRELMQSHKLLATLKQSQLKPF